MKKSELYKIIKEELKKELYKEQLRVRNRRSRRRRPLRPSDREKLRPFDREKPRPFDGEKPIATGGGGNVQYTNWGLYYCVADDSSTNGTPPYVGFRPIGSQFCCDGADNPNGMSSTDGNYPAGASSNFAFGASYLNCLPNCDNPTAANSWNNWLTSIGGTPGNTTQFISSTDQGAVSANAPNTNEGEYTTAAAAGAACCPQFGNTLNGTCVGCMNQDDPNYDAGYTIDDQNDCQGTTPDESYNCINNVCTDPGDGTGTYTSLTDCQTDGCESTSVDCIDNTCTVVQGSGGAYVDMAACEASGCEDTGPTPEACHDVTVVRCNPRGGTDQQNLSCITIDGQAVNLDEPATSQLRMGSITLPSANSPGDTYEVPAIYQVVQATPTQGTVTDYPFGNCKGKSPSDPFDKELEKAYDGPKVPFQESKKLRKNLRDEFLLSEEQKLRKIIKHILKNKNNGR